MTEEKELIKKRASFKGRLTSFSNYLDCLHDQSMDVSDFKELELRLGKMEILYGQYDEIQLALECVSEDVNIRLSERSEFESLYYKAIIRAKGLLSDMSKNHDSSLHSDNAQLQNTMHRPVKLPTIQLPKFNGSYDNWLEFRDTFTSLIHLNSDIDNINKFHYLRASLEGSAALVIQSVVFSSNNYMVAWNLLCDRYNNKNLLIQNHIASLFNIETVTKEGSSILKKLIDKINKNLRSLESLGEPVQQWDTLLIYIITSKLDSRTYREWEEFKGRLESKTPLTFDIFINFLRNRASILESLELSRNSNVKPSPKLRSMVAVHDSLQIRNNKQFSSQKLCPKCNGEHDLQNCSIFLALNNDARYKLLPTLKVCFNCLQRGHFANRCKKSGCNICKRRHNSLVHMTEGPALNTITRHSDNIISQPSASTSVVNSSEPVALSTSVTYTCSESKQRDVLLSTALIKLYDNNNHAHVVRAVLDSGSTSSFISESLFHKLNLSYFNIDRSVVGINNVSSHVGQACRIKITSINDGYCSDLYCFILPSIIEKTPSSEIDLLSFNIPPGICLADPKFYKPSDVDILIGADLFWDLLGSQRIKLGNGKPILCETKLGWIVSGPFDCNYIKVLSNDNLKCNLNKLSSFLDIRSDDIRADLTRFWNLEEVNSKSSQYLPEEKLCEEHFIQNTTRLSDGRFCVRIPIKQNPSVLGNSYNRATQFLYSLERRLVKNTEFSQLYHDFMTEYQLLGHMTPIKSCNINFNNYFIPHHGILRENSTTTKLRVVFNASCPSTSNISFNDIQMVGPTVQDDLLSILLRFRQHKYILSADVEKMYRQIMVHPSDRCLQQILWRRSTREPIQAYELNTVTYGTASAPFLATRCLRQLGLECKDEKIAEIINRDFYVDDLLTGTDDFDEAVSIRDEVTKTLASACMPLRKWKSNEPKLLVSKGSSSTLNLDIGSSAHNKLLGLYWQVDSDLLKFPIGSLKPKSNKNTKRDLLSIIAQIFDPLGLLAPFVITMKCFMQQLWLDKYSWDEPLTPEVADNFSKILESLPLLNNIQIPRRVVCDSHRVLQLHIFTDASERAYGACAYIRSINNQGEVSVHLLIAKSRVAPIKPTTIPRLELCGALVGARLYEKIVNSFRMELKQVFCWTDSTIVLGWLQMLPSKLQPFVRNRVADILDKAGICTWRHVPTDQNPADLISRGMDISKLQNSYMWFSGPDFLKKDISLWPSKFINYSKENLPETRHEVVLSTITVKNCTDYNEFIDFYRFSNYSRLVRSVAYVLRFINFCKKKQAKTTFLIQEELENALNIIIKKCQDQSFPEYRLLLNKHNLPKKSSLLKFNIFLDENNIMRIGGRLENSNFSFNKKHPILIQSTHVFTKLLFDFEHKRLMHAGPQLLLASIRELYWPIGGRNLAKVCYHKCIRCNRMKGKTLTPLMGNLPEQRLNPGGYPFENVGIDYAGPILSASRQGRGCRLMKVYIAIFVCFSTKAMHLELVGDLTSNNFLLALYRFISRRGKPLNIYCDNGTSFVGAYNDISKFLKCNRDSIGETLNNDQINFHFIPAYSPHFGGLWEAGVKSTKFHLNRVLGNCHLTFEQLYTTLTQIEAILNSRPLTPLSSDPADCTPLTPGHFIIGRSLTSLPQKDYLNASDNILSRFQHIERLRQQFWNRWQKEYVSELQERTKWRMCKDSLKLNTLVVIKEDNLPPLKWKLGRIVTIYPGTDGISRVADIKTSTGVIRRAFTKICPLPVTS